MAGPLLLRLQDELRLAREARFDLFGVASDHDEQPRGRQALARPQDVAEHRHTAQFVQHLRAARLHSRPLARGQDDHGVSLNSMLL